VPQEFARLVSLACHDLRTPLATVQGFAKTLLRTDAPPEQQSRYLGIIDEASTELVGLTDRLSLAARIEGGRYDPVRQEADSLELARTVDEAASGTGAAVHVDHDAVVRALADLHRAATRHGGVEPAVRVDGTLVTLQPVAAEAAPTVLGEDAKDLGASVAVLLLRALGGDVEHDGDVLSVRLPA
jgi:signal transduction histidine kinase